MNLPDYLLVLEGLLFFLNVPSIFSITLTLSRSLVSISRFNTSETFSDSFRTSLTIRFPIPFFRKELDQPPILYENFDLSTERNAIFCQMPIISMVFTEFASIPLEWVGLHLLRPSERWIPLYSREHLGEADVQWGEDFLLESQWLRLPRLTFE
jgi:hypothetical protein